MEAADGGLDRTHGDWPEQLLQALRREAAVQGFSQIGVGLVDLTSAEPGMVAWLAAGFHGRMEYMARHGFKRSRPDALVPGTISIITARMDYLPRADGEPTASDWQSVEWARIGDPTQATVSLYARGRDYHKTLRQRLQRLADHLQSLTGPLGLRVFTDSAPVLEVELATRSGLGWRGKHTLALHRDAGSMFFLGEIFVDVALPPTPPVTAHCGACEACIEVCPTRAIVAPYRLDARRCISYLTIEHDGAIPVELRPLMGNRIYGCDDCQLVCPWNKYARRSALADFDVRGPLADRTLLQLWNWSEAEFLRQTEGSAIRRIGHWRWRRNLAVALGNLLRRTDPAAPLAAEVRAALTRQRSAPDALISEHIDWALASQQA